MEGSNSGPDAVADQVHYRALSRREIEEIPTHVSRAAIAALGRARARAPAHLAGLMFEFELNPRTVRSLWKDKRFDVCPNALLDVLVRQRARD